MNWEQFTRRLRSELPGHKSSVDADEIWAAIEPAVEQINSGGKVIYKRLGLLLLLITLVGGGVGVYAALDQPTGQQAGIVLSNIGHERSATDWTASGLHSDEVATHKAGITARGVLTQSEAGSDALSMDGPGQTQSAVTATHLPSRRNSAIEKPGTAIPSSRQRTAALDNDVPNRVRAEKVSRKEHRETTRVNPDMGSVEDVDRGQDGYRATKELSGLDYEQQSDMTNNRTSRRNGIETSEVLMASVATASSVMLSSHNQTIQSLSFAAYNKVSPKTECPSFKPKNFSFLLGVHGGVTYPLRNLSAKQDDGDLATRRDETESTMVSGNMGIDFLVRHRIGLEFGLGVQYLSMLQRFDLERTVTTTEMEFGVQAISVNPLGDTTYITGMVPVTTTRTEKKRFYNKYKFTEIPITFGYSHEVKNWRIGGEAAVILGILTKTEGKVLDENEEIVDLNADHPSVSGAKFGASYYFGASLVHQFDSGFEMGLHPHARISPTDYSAAEYSVRSKYVHVGLNVSVRYRLGR